MSIQKIKSEVSKYFLCSTCEERYDQRAKAVNCCAEASTTWVCNTCDNEHETKKEAQECCCEWECQECGEVFAIKEDIKDHVCNFED